MNKLSLLNRSFGTEDTKIALFLVCFFPLLLKVDMQNMHKENERLYAENKGNNLELEKLQEENKALHASLSKQGPSEGDKSDTKVLKINVLKMM